MYIIILIEENNIGDYMQKIGISRRIDELGRIVIPKEIRKNLKIRESDEVDISVDGENIILNKHNDIDYDRVIDRYILQLGKYLRKNIFFTSKERIISYYNINGEVIDNLELDSSIIELILKRKNTNNSNSNYNFLNKYYEINPIIINGDLLGSIICFSNNEINDIDRMFLKFSSLFFEKYLEYE